MKTVITTNGTEIFISDEDFEYAQRVDGKRLLSLE